MNNYAWLISAALGALVGVSGIATRYRDEPTRVLGTLPALLYVLLNAAVSVLAYGLAYTFGWDFGAPSPEATPLVQAIVAGLGGMVLLRSSVYTLRVGDQDVSIGPYALLQSLLNMLDREVDRHRAKSRAATISRIMKDVSFERAYQPLPAYCFALMQNLDHEEQARFANALKAIYTSQMSDHTKALLLGAQLLNLVGENVLDAAVKGLEAQIKPSKEPA